MRKTFFLILGIAAILVSCSKEKDEKSPVLTVSSTSVIQFTAAALQSESVTLTVTTNQSSWSVSSNQSWCKVSADMQTNKFTVSATPNTAVSDSPAATITVSAGGAKPVTIQAVQKGETAEMSSIADYVVAAEAGKLELPVKTNVQFEVTSADNWITYSGTRTATTKNIELNIAKNDEANPRNTTVTVKQTDGAKNLSKTFVVYQLPKAPNKAVPMMDNNNGGVTMDNKSQLIDVALQNEIKEVKIPAEAALWLQRATIGPITKATTHNLTLLVATNTSAVMRSADIKIVTGASTSTLHIVQGGTATQKYKVTFTGFRNYNIAQVRVTTDQGTTELLPFASDRSIQLLGLGKLLSAQFVHKDSKTVVDWWGSATGVSIDKALTLDLMGFAGGDGTKNNPWLVSNVRHLVNIWNYDQKEKYFKQINDIDLSDVTGNYPNAEGTDFDPSKKNNNAPFAAYGGELYGSHNAVYDYDGNNFSLIGYRGKGSLFCVVKRIRNVTFDKTTMLYGSAIMEVQESMENCKGYHTVVVQDAEGRAGMLKWLKEKGTLKNCIFNGRFAKAEGSPAVGICYDVAALCVVENCVNKASWNCGGGAGVLLNCGYGVTIKGCRNEGNLTKAKNPNGDYSGSTSNIAGVVGNIDNMSKDFPMTISDCENTGNITVTHHNQGNISGVLGWVSAKNGIKGSLVVRNCVNRGKITCNAAPTDIHNSVSGIIAVATSNSGCVGRLEIIDCVNYGDISWSGQGDVAGVAGRCEDGITLNKCENKGNIAGVSAVGGVAAYSNHSLIKNCTNRGAVTNIWNEVQNGGFSYIYTGGILGNGMGEKVLECTNHGKVTNGRDVGGIVGYSYRAEAIDKCTNNGVVAVKNYDKTKLNPDCQPACGGILGRSADGIGSMTYNINNAAIKGSTYTGGLLGLSTALTMEGCVNNGVVNTNCGIVGFWPSIQYITPNEALPPGHSNSGDMRAAWSSSCYSKAKDTANKYWTRTNTIHYKKDPDNGWNWIYDYTSYLDYGFRL